MPTTISMQWFIDLCEAVQAMPDDAALREQQIYESCPWCRVGLEHTRREHYMTKPQEESNATFH